MKDKSIQNANKGYDIKEATCGAYNLETGNCDMFDKPCDCCYSEVLREKIK